LEEEEEETMCDVKRAQRQFSRSEAARSPAAIRRFTEAAEQSGCNKPPISNGTPFLSSVSSNGSSKP